MATKIQRVTFDDFSGGHYSARGPFRSPVNQIGGFNWHVYANGTVGPRPGIFEQTLSAGTYPTPTTGHFLRGIWVPPNDEATYPKGWFCMAHSETGKGFRINVATLALTIWNGPTDRTLQPASSPSAKQTVEWVNPAEISWAGDSIVEPDAGTITNTAYDGGAWPSSDIPEGSNFFKDRHYFFGTQARNRVYYSDPQVFAASGADLFFNIGPGDAETNRWRVFNLYPMKNGLLICAIETSTDNRGIWYMLSGASPETGSLREVDRGRRPITETSACVWRNGLWFLPANGRGITLHSGADIDDKTFDYLRPYDEHLPQDYDNSMAARTAVGLDVIPGLILPFTSTNTGTATPGGESNPMDLATDWREGVMGFEWVNGAFSKQIYLGSGVAGTDGFYGMLDVSAFQYDKLAFLLTEGGQDDAQITFATRDFVLNRPGSDDDEYSSQLHDEVDPSSGTNLSEMVFRSHGIEPNPGERVRVVRVQIEVDYWYLTNHFDAPLIDRIRVRHFGQVDANTASVDDDSYIIDLAGDTAVDASSDPWPQTGYIPLRRMIEIDCDYGFYHGPFRIELYRVRNMAIRRLIVDVEVDDQGLSRV